MVGGIPSPSPQNVHDLIPGTHEYVTRQGKRDFTDVTSLRGLRWGDYPSGPNVNKRVLIRGRHKGLSLTSRCYDGSRSQGEVGLGIRNRGMQSGQKECSPAGPFRISDLQNWKIIHLFCF